MLGLILGLFEYLYGDVGRLDSTCEERTYRK